MATAKPTPSPTSTHEAAPPRPLTARDFAAAFRTPQTLPTWAFALLGAVLGTLLAWVTVP